MKNAKERTKDPITIRVSLHDLDCILAGLRLLDYVMYTPTARVSIPVFDDIARIAEEREPVEGYDLDYLAKALNTGERDVEEP